MSRKHKTVSIGFHIQILDCVIARRCITYTTSSLCLAKIIIWKSISQYRMFKKIIE